MSGTYFLTFGTDRLVMEGEAGSIVWEENTPAPMNIPAGLIEPFAGSTVPVGFLLCDGTAVSRTVYATLYSVIGDTFGAGDGETTFNLPDLSGRVPLGVSMSHALGTTGGSETVTLDESELPAHVHEVPQHGHANTIGATTPALGHTITQPVFKYNKPNASKGGMLTTGNNVYNSTTTGTATRGTNVAIGAHAAADCTMSGSIANKDAFDSDTTGGSLSHNNLQPYLAIAYIISTGE